MTVSGKVLSLSNLLSIARAMMAGCRSTKWCHCVSTPDRRQATGDNVLTGSTWLAGMHAHTHTQKSLWKRKSTCKWSHFSPEECGFLEGVLIPSTGSLWSFIEGQIVNKNDALEDSELGEEMPSCSIYINAQGFMYCLTYSSGLYIITGFCFNKRWVMLSHLIVTAILSMLDLKETLYTHFYRESVWPFVRPSPFV